ncbi:hypothetical protein L9F63_002083, partial [Diploptera punctata]
LLGNLCNPGLDSGCTAVVALLKGQELYVANAGDSRCVVCRKGQAIEMSLDHKPEDDIERTRIENAGGRITCDGRVNGGLNLSRALGDHASKQSECLPAEGQMDNEDEFMVLACDGIWNFMSSQEVVDFIRERMQKGENKLSKICEELFDHCLAPKTFGDGTGCDNMTAVIVQFRPELANSNESKCLKRSSSPAESEHNKRPRIEETENTEPKLEDVVRNRNEKKLNFDIRMIPNIPMTTNKLKHDDKRSIDLGNPCKSFFH